MKKFFAGFLILSLAFMSDSSASVQAQGRTYSSGGGRSSSSTPSRSSSTPSRSSPTPSRSYTTPAGRTYSSGSTPRVTPPSTPRVTPPSTPRVTPSTPPSTSRPPANITPPPTQPRPSATTPAGRTYSSSGGTPQTQGTPHTSGAPPPASSNSRRPTSTGLNNALSNSANRVESQRRFEAATAPKPTYRTPGPSGVERPITPTTPQVQTVRRYVTHERYVTYDNRCSVFYGSYYGHPVYYRDYYSPFLMGWILSDAVNSHQRALWMYHHGSIASGGSIDDARYAELLRRDARLQAEIDQLRSQNVVRDPSYVPPQMADNPDVMFNREFVDASYNPQEVRTNNHTASSGAGTFFFWLFVVFAVVVVGGVLIYFVFMKDY